MTVLADQLFALLLLKESHLDAALGLVLNEVQPDDLVDGANAKLAVFLQRIEEDEAQQAGLNGVAEGAEDLNAKQVWAARVGKSVVDIEDPDCHDRLDAAGTLHLLGGSGAVVPGPFREAGHRDGGRHSHLHFPVRILAELAAGLAAQGR